MIDYLAQGLLLEFGDLPVNDMLFVGAEACFDDKSARTEPHVFLLGRSHQIGRRIDGLARQFRQAAANRIDGRYGQFIG